MLTTQTKEKMVGTVEAVQALQVQSTHLQKSKEGYHAKCLELDRLRKEGAPQKELEKVKDLFCMDSVQSSTLILVTQNHRFYFQEVSKSTHFHYYLSIFIFLPGSGPFTIYTDLQGNSNGSYSV